jgi:hypothetical protein
LDFNPDIVAIVETWLTEKVSDEMVKSYLGLSNYKFYRRDRVDTDESGRVRRGGGMIIAVKSGLSSEFLDSYNDNFLAITLTYAFNCPKCCGGSSTQQFSFGLVYRRKSPYTKGQTRGEFNEASDSLWKKVHHFVDDGALFSGSVLVGDFNLKFGFEEPDVSELRQLKMLRFMAGEPQLKGFKMYLNSAYERELYEPLEKKGFKQKVEDATHTDGNMLDLILSLPPNFVDEVANFGNIAVEADKQDHCILAFTLVLGEDCDKK